MQETLFLLDEAKKPKNDFFVSDILSFEVVPIIGLLGHQYYAKQL